ncbi:MAG: branched-chain amino acid transport system II carrier protein [Clostridiales bacterium]|nr:branched-chain amino acid transport system II carrier protein [Clostridiales bacterium]
MKKKLTKKETIIVASTLFGMFFGAGNMIFPVHLGQMAGSNSWPAIIGFIITAVGIPIFGVAAIGNTRSDNLLVLSSKVTNWYGFAFTTLLYLTIGPFFAIPRCATTSFTMGLAPFIKESSYVIAQLLFTLIFFAVVLFFSLRPSGITTWIGKIINPMFLIFFATLIVVAAVNPAARVADIVPEEAYKSGAFFNGFIEGYATMDAIAGLAFGIVIINVVRGLGIEADDDLAKETIKAGFFTALLMGLIYILTVTMGAQSRGLFATSDNGGIALTQISSHYLGGVGSIILALTVTFACLKTAIGLVTSCAEMFVTMYPKSFSYNAWAIIFSVFSFAVSNVGLTAIIAYSIPVLMLLYPLAIVLIAMALTEKLFGKSKYVYMWVTAGAALSAVFDFAKTLPEGIQTALNIPVLTAFASKIFPFFDLGLGWIVPSLIGLAVGLVITTIKKKQIV